MLFLRFYHKCHDFKIYMIMYSYYKRFIVYISWWLFFTLLDWSLFTIFLYFWKNFLSPYILQIFSFGIVVVFSFLFHSKQTFWQTNTWYHQFVYFVMIQVLAIVIATWFFIYVDWIFHNYMLAFVVSRGVAAILSFFAHTYITFRTKQ